jgi:hypothetical protein
MKRELEDKRTEFQNLNSLKNDAISSPSVFIDSLLKEVRQ